MAQFGDEVEQFGDEVEQFGDIHLEAITYFLLMYFHLIKLFGYRKDSIDVILVFKVSSMCEKVAPMKPNFTCLYGTFCLLSRAPKMIK